MLATKWTDHQTLLNHCARLWISFKSERFFKWSTKLTTSPVALLLFKRWTTLAIHSALEVPGTILKMLSWSACVTLEKWIKPNISLKSEGKINQLSLTKRRVKKPNSDQLATDTIDWLHVFKEKPISLERTELGWHWRSWTLYQILIPKVDGVQYRAKYQID